MGGAQSKMGAGKSVMGGEQMRMGGGKSGMGNEPGAGDVVTHASGVPPDAYCSPPTA